MSSFGFVVVSAFVAFAGPIAYWLLTDRDHPRRTVYHAVRKSATMHPRR